MIIMADNTAGNYVGSTLDHLLETEAAAAAIVEDAQKEADKRIHDNEEKNRAVFDERYKAEVRRHLSLLNEEIEKIKVQYKKTLDDHRNEISGLSAEKEEFCALLNKYILIESAGSG